jgi:SNF2 family DNA or RNA helicase
MNNTTTAMKLPDMTLQHFLVRAGVRENLPFAQGIVMNPAMVPMKHQVTGLNQVLAYTRYGIYDEPGLGKTLIAQAAALYMAGYGNKVVIIMPPILLEQFEKEMDHTFYGWRDYVSFHVLNEGPDKRCALFEKWRATDWPDIMCLSYKQFAKLPKPKKKKNKETGKMEPVGPPNPDDNICHVLKTAGYNYAICDEAHALKNPSSNMHKAVKYLLGKEGEAGLMLMTGTPVPNELTDAYGMIDIVTPGKYASMRSFQRLHCIYRTNDDGWSTLIGYQNREVMSTHLYARARRVPKDVLGLKKPQVIEFPVNLDPAHHALYKKLIRERFLEMGDKIISAMNQQALRMKSLQIITTPELFTHANLKNEIFGGVDQLIDSIGIREEKVVVFAHFRESVESLVRHFDRLGYNPAVIYGGAGSNVANKNKFLEDDTCRVLVANPRSGGVGLNLQSVCRYAIFAEPTSVPGDFKQASERIHRKGQTKVVTIYILKALGTVAPQATKNMLKKEGETIGIVRDSTSMLDELLGRVT